VSTTGDQKLEDEHQRAANAGEITIQTHAQKKDEKSESREAMKLRAKRWLGNFSSCYKISPGQQAQLDDGELTATKLYVANIKDYAAIISVKGWGGGMERADYMAHLGVHPGSGNQTPDQEFVEAAAEEFDLVGKAQVLNALAAEKSRGKLPSRIFLQWEADDIWDETDGHASFAVYIYGVARVLQTRFGSRFGGFIAQKLDNKKDKTTKQAIVPLDKAEKLRSQKGMQALADVFNLPVYLEVHPSFGEASIHRNDADKAIGIGAVEVADVQRHSNFGFWGHAAHCQFSDVKAIVSYGGGNTVSAEEKQGYSLGTKVIGIGVTRKSGKEISEFATKHQLMDQLIQ
jgi:hypothetical protein